MQKLWSDRIRMRMLLLFSLVFVGGILLAKNGLFLDLKSIAHAQTQPIQALSHWLQGTQEQRWEKTARHFRGLDQAMIEIGYRYSELYWAGQEKNGAYVRYQLDKIELALQLAIERRPKRRASADLFLKQDLAEFRQALVQAQPQDFNAHFARLTQACNRCHQIEQVPFIHIQAPEQRLSPVSWRP